MPLIAGTITAPPRTPVPAPADVRQPLQITYIDPDGVVWPWSDPSSGCVVRSVTGIGSPPASYTGTALPGGASLPQAYGASQRSIVIGLHVFDEESQAGLLDMVDRLAFALWGARAGAPAPGTLVVARPDGTRRQIEVLCTSGPEQADADSSRNAYQTSTDFGLTFVSALDPMFSDAEDTVVSFSAAPAGAGVPPMPPVVLSPSAVLGTVQVTNRGNGDAWPVWTLSGPGTPTVTNTTTGRSWGLDVALLDGETVTVDTRPARQSALDGTGADRWSDLVKSSPRDLWSLPPGVNDLNLQMTGSGANSRIQMAYRRRWLRA